VTSIQKKSKSFSKPGSSAVQASRDANSAQSQDMPSYSTPGADLLTANIMRSVETEEHSEALDSTVQRQSEPGRAAVAAVAPPIVSIPVVQPNSVGIQRQCSECAEKQQQPSEEEGKDVLEKSQAASGIQTKLTVGAIGDAYEQEADRVAAQVMSMPVAAAAPRQVQRFGEEPSPVGMYSSLARSITPVVHRRVDQQVQMRELVQRAFEAGGNEASGDLESRLNASSGGGNALAPEVRAFMEPRFGADFSSVRVHTGGEAVQMNRELGAQAFAHGSDVYFGAGKEPGNNELTAHELTHVVQQTGAVRHKTETLNLTAPPNNKQDSLLVQRQGSNQPQCKDFNCWFELGLDAIKNERFQEALDAYNRAIAINPDDKGAHNNQGVALDGLGNYTGALKAFQTALQIDPSYKLAQSNLQIILDKLSENEKRDFVLELGNSYRSIKEKIDSLNQRLEKFPNINFAQELWARYSGSAQQLSQMLSDAANFRIGLDPGMLNTAFVRVVNSLASPTVGVVLVGTLPLSGFLLVLKILIDVLLLALVVAAAIAILYAIYLIIKKIVEMIEEAIKELQQEEEAGSTTSNPSGSEESNPSQSGTPQEEEEHKPVPLPEGRREDPDGQVDFYHGTDESTADKFKNGMGVRPSGGGEFGQGFYTFIEQPPAELVAEQYTRNRRPPLPKWGVVDFQVPVNVLVRYFEVGAIADLIGGDIGNVLYFPDKDTTPVEVSYPDDVSPGLTLSMTWKEFVNKNRDLRRQTGRDISWPYDLIVGPLSGRLPGYRDIDQFMFNDYGVHMLNDPKVKRNLVARGDTGIE